MRSGGHFTPAATDRQLLGTNYVGAPYFVDAMRARDTVFTVAPSDHGGFEFVYSPSILRLIPFNSGSFIILFINITIS